MRENLNENDEKRRLAYLGIGIGSLITGILWMLGILH